MSKASQRSLSLILLLVPLLVAADWPTYMHDAQRTGTSGETVLGASNASQLAKLWSFKTGGVVAASPAIVNNVAYVGSWDGYEYALDAQTGALKWKTYLGITTADPSCSPQTAGVTSSAAVVSGVVYVGGGDSYWYALNATTGSILWKVFTGDNSAAGGYYNWASPLIYNGYAYIGLASMGDCPLIPGALLQVNLSTHAVTHRFDAVQSGQVGGAIWTSPSIDPVSKTIYVTTGTEVTPSQTYAQSVIALDATTLTVKSYWHLPESQAIPDADWGTTPILFTTGTGKKMVAAANKNGYVYAFDRSNVSAGPLWQRQVAIGGAGPQHGEGTASSPAFGGNTLFQAGGNSSIGGTTYPGSVRALDPATGNFRWEHAAPGAVVPAVTYVNGLVLDATGSNLEVLDATTGSTLYQFASNGPIWSAPSVSNGRILFGSGDGSVYALAVPATPPPTSTPDPTCPDTWNCADIGGPSTRGSQSLNGSTWTISGGGADIWGTVDQFHYVWQSLSGDGSVQAHVTSQTNDRTWAKAGVMMRQSTRAGAAFYAVYVTPGNGIVVQYRNLEGASAVALAQVAGVVPAFLKVTRSGSTYVAYTSADGSTWSVVAGSSLTLPFTGPVLAGVAVTSHDDTFLSTITADSVAVSAAGGTATATALASPTPSPTFTPSPSATPTATSRPGCPSPWICADIGGPALSGSQSLSGGVWTISGSGVDIWDSSDQFHFVYQTFTGDGTLQVRVATQTNNHPWAKAGVMFRQSSDAGSPFYAAFVTPNNGITVQYRSGQSAVAVEAARVPGTAPAYLRINRSGTAYSASTSPDGVSWTLISGSGTTIAMASPLLEGLAVTSHDSSAMSTATLDSVALIPGSGTATSTPTATSTYTATTTPTATPTNSPTTTPNPTAPATNTPPATPTATDTPTNTPPPTAATTNTPTSTTTATSTPTSTATTTLTPTPVNGCPAPWTCADVGSPTTSGSQSYSNGTWTISGAGVDIWGTSDQFHYVWQTLSGDGGIQTRITSQTNDGPWAKAGVMLRQSTDPGSAFYAAYITPGNGISVQYRTAQGADASQAVQVPGALPAYLRVARAGSVFTALTSTDGATWTTITGSNVTMTWSDPILSGMAVVSKNPGNPSVVTFDAVAQRTGRAVQVVQDQEHAKFSGGLSIRSSPNESLRVRHSGRLVRLDVPLCSYFHQTAIAVRLRNMTSPAHVSARLVVRFSGSGNSACSWQVLSLSRPMKVRKGDLVSLALSPVGKKMPLWGSDALARSSDLRGTWMGQRVSFAFRAFIARETDGGFSQPSNRREGLALQGDRLKVRKQAKIALGVYMPAAPASVLALDRYRALLGSSPAIVMWYQTWGERWSAFSPRQMRHVWSRHAVPMITWEPWQGRNPDPAYSLRNITNGAFDAYIQRWAKGAKAWGHPFFLRFAHEMNGGWYPWGTAPKNAEGNSPPDYVAAWHHVHDIFSRLGAANVIWVWSPNTSFEGATPAALDFPGERYVDNVGLDGYNYGPPQEWVSFSRLFAGSYADLSRLTKRPMMITETASAEAGGDKAAWISDAFRILPESFSRVRAVIWFDEHQGRHDFRVNSSGRALDAFRSVAHNPLYRRNLYRELSSRGLWKAVLL